MTNAQTPLGMTEIQKALLMPFDPKKVHWRVGATNKKKQQDPAKHKGIALGYLDARDVMERLDEVMGIDGWQCNYPFAGMCNLGLLLPKSYIDQEHEYNWIWKANAAGTTQIEAEKGQASDAFKRAAVLFGVGRCYYDLPNVWHPLGKWGFADGVEENLTNRLGAWQEAWVKKNIK